MDARIEALQASKTVDQAAKAAAWLTGALQPILRASPQASADSIRQLAKEHGQLISSVLKVVSAKLDPGAEPALLRELSGLAATGLDCLDRLRSVLKGRPLEVEIQRYSFIRKYSSLAMWSAGLGQGRQLHARLAEHLATGGRQALCFNGASKELLDMFAACVLNQAICASELCGSGALSPLDSLQELQQPLAHFCEWLAVDGAAPSQHAAALFKYLQALAARMVAEPKLWAAATPQRLALAFLRNLLAIGAASQQLSANLPQAVTRLCATPGAQPGAVACLWQACASLCVLPADDRTPVAFACLSAITQLAAQLKLPGVAGLLEDEGLDPPCSSRAAAQQHPLTGLHRAALHLASQAGGGACHDWCDCLDAAVTHLQSLLPPSAAAAAASGSARAGDGSDGNGTLQSELQLGAEQLLMLSEAVQELVGSKPGTQQLLQLVGGEAAAQALGAAMGLLPRLTLQLAAQPAGASAGQAQQRVTPSAAAAAAATALHLLCAAAAAAAAQDASSSAQAAALGDSAAASGLRQLLAPPPSVGPGHSDREDAAWTAEQLAALATQLHSLAMDLVAAALPAHAAIMYCLAYASCVRALHAAPSAGGLTRAVKCAKAAATSLLQAGAHMAAAQAAGEAVVQLCTLLPRGCSAALLAPLVKLHARALPASGQVGSSSQQGSTAVANAGSSKTGKGGGRKAGGRLKALQVVPPGADVSRSAPCMGLTQQLVAAAAGGGKAAADQLLAELDVVAWLEAAQLQGRGQRCADLASALAEACHLAASAGSTIAHARMLVVRAGMASASSSQAAEELLQQACALLQEDDGRAKPAGGRGGGKKDGDGKRALQPHPEAQDSAAQAHLALAALLASRTVAEAEDASNSGCSSSQQAPSQSGHQDFDQAAAASTAAAGRVPPDSLQALWHRVLQHIQRGSSCLSASLHQPWGTCVLRFPAVLCQQVVQAWHLAGLQGCAELQQQLAALLPHLLALPGLDSRAQQRVSAAAALMPERCWATWLWSLEPSCSLLPAGGAASAACDWPGPHMQPACQLWAQQAGSRIKQGWAAYEQEACLERAGALVAVADQLGAAPAAERSLSLLLAQAQCSALAGMAAAQGGDVVAALVQAQQALKLCAGLYASLGGDSGSRSRQPQEGQPSSEEGDAASKAASSSRLSANAQADAAEAGCSSEEEGQQADSAATGAGTSSAPLEQPAAGSQNSWWRAVSMYLCTLYAAAELYELAGAPEDAAQLLRECLAVASSVHATPFVVLSACLLARIATKRRQPEAATQHVQLAHDWLQLRTSRGGGAEPEQQRMDGELAGALQAQLHISRAQLCGLRDRWDQAEGHCQEALQLLQPAASAAGASWRTRALLFDAQLQLSEALERQGRWEAARDALLAVLLPVTAVPAATAASGKVGGGRSSSSPADWPRAFPLHAGPAIRRLAQLQGRGDASLSVPEVKPGELLVVGLMSCSGTASSGGKLDLGSRLESAVGGAPVKVAASSQPGGSRGGQKGGKGGRGVKAGAASGKSASGAAKGAAAASRAECSSSSSGATSWERGGPVACMLSALRLCRHVPLELRACCAWLLEAAAAAGLPHAATMFLHLSLGATSTHLQLLQLAARAGAAGGLHDVTGADAAGEQQAVAAARQLLDNLLVDATATAAAASAAAGDGLAQVEHAAERWLGRMLACLPAGSAVTALCGRSDGHGLYVSRAAVGQPPVLLLLPVPDPDLPVEAAGAAGGMQGVQALLTQLHSTLQRSADSMKLDAAGLDSAAKKAKWWKSRLQIDEEMGRLLLRLEEDVLGPWHCLLLPPPSANGPTAATAQQAAAQLVAEQFESLSGDPSIPLLQHLLALLLAALPQLSSGQVHAALRGLCTASGHRSDHSHVAGMAAALMAAHADAFPSMPVEQERAVSMATCDQEDQQAAAAAPGRRGKARGDARPRMAAMQGDEAVGAKQGASRGRAAAAGRQAAAEEEEEAGGAGDAAGGRDQAVGLGATRASCVLVLDAQLQQLPWESMPGLRQHQTYRMPSLAVAAATALRLATTGNRTAAQPGSTAGVARGKAKGGPRAAAPQEGPALPPLRQPAAGNVPTVDLGLTYYLLNPGGDLMDTQLTFEAWFSRQLHWKGASGHCPPARQLLDALGRHDMFVYCGHGAGDQYLPPGALRRLQRCAANLLMGCSSGRLRDLGDYEPSGAVLGYLSAGCPALVANLWDVTDKDIDRFAQALLSSCLGQQPPVGVAGPASSAARAETGRAAPLDAVGGGTSLAQAVGASRAACKLPHLIGAAPVCYGIPTLCTYKAVSAGRA